MAKTIAQMSASEYQAWLQTAPSEEIKKLDESPAPRGTVPTGLWRNGMWIPASSEQIQKPE